MILWWPFVLAFHAYAGWLRFWATLYPRWDDAAETAKLDALMATNPAPPEESSYVPALASAMDEAQAKLG